LAPASFSLWRTWTITDPSISSKGRNQATKKKFTPQR
jgi:hypothetical protein